MRSRVGSDLSIFKQAVNHHVAAMLRAVRIANRRVQRWSFGKACQQRSFFEREIFGVLAEVKLRARFESIDSMSEEYLVGVHGEDLLLSESPLDLNRQHDLLDFAAEILIR